MQYIDPVAQFRGNSYVVSLTSAEEVKKAYKLGEFKISSSFGLCSISLPPWTGDVVSDGIAMGTGTWVRLWNLPLHYWSWQVVVVVLRPVGDLVAISQGSQSSESYLEVLIRLRHRASIPHKVELNIGVRSFIMLITRAKDSWPVFQRDLDKFIVAPCPEEDGTVEDTNSRGQKQCWKQEPDQPVRLVKPRTDQQSGLILYKLLTKC